MLLQACTIAESSFRSTELDIVVFSLSSMAMRICETFNGRF